MSELPLFRQRWPNDVLPTVSVLVPAYNQERFIERCLVSILQQVTDFSVEIIVRDDASVDKTAAVIQSYAKRYPQLIKPVFHKENRYSSHKKPGPSIRSLAKGNFIARCDGDDFWTDKFKLAKQVDFLVKNPSFVLSFHNAVHVDEDGKGIPKKFNLPLELQRDYSKEDLRELKWGWMLLGTVVHRNVPIVYPPEYALVPNRDNFLPMLLAPYGGAKFQSEVGPLAYCQHSDGIWSQKTPKERAAMHLQSYLQIASYFIRIGESKTASAIINRRLTHYLSKYLAMESSGEN